MTQGQFLCGVYQVWLQSFPSPRLVASPRLKNLVCPTILPIAGGRIIGFIPFLRVLVLCEMQSISSRIWTRVAVFISYDDNHYTTGTSPTTGIFIMCWVYKCTIILNILSNRSIDDVTLSPEEMSATWSAADYSVGEAIIRLGRKEHKIQLDFNR